MQPAIDAAALELMREFNKSSGGSSRSSGEGKEKEKEKEEEKYFLAVPTVYNTTQCYLRGATEKLRGELELAAKEGFSWGGKLVRGAYIDSENKRADAAKVPSPCWSSIGETHECYDACARIAVEEGVFAWGEKVREKKKTKRERPTKKKKTRKSRKKTKTFFQHNKASVSKAVDLLSRLEREQPAGDASSSRVSFGQLYGMR